jgi:serine O-acetyltransferase
MDLPRQLDVGGGFTIVHGWGVVISSGARIGANVTIFHGVTIGRRDRISRDGDRITGYPTVEDQVWIGPHAIIVGPITIGRGARIGGGAFVDVDVPPFTVYVGNPGRVAKEGCTPDVMNAAPL